MAAWLVACGTSAPKTRLAESLLSVGRLFGVKEFDTEPLPARRWSKRSSTYFTLEKPATGTGRELIRNDPATGKKEVVVPATAFVPGGAKEPLAVEAYEFSADESRVLIYTNSQRVWRRNTRGDYWVLDVATRKLSKLGGDAAPSSLMFATFSPDGTRVAFVRENNLYVQDLAEPEDHPADHRRLEDAHQRHVRLGQRRGTGPAELLPLEPGRPPPPVLAVRHHRRGGVSPRR